MVATVVTVAVLQDLRLVTAMNDYERAPVCAGVRSMWACHAGHNEGQFQFTLPLNFKSIRAVQQRYKTAAAAAVYVFNTSEPPAAALIAHTYT